MYNLKLGYFLRVCVCVLHNVRAWRGIWSSLTVFVFSDLLHKQELSDEASVTSPALGGLPGSCGEKLYTARRRRVRV